MTVNVPRLPSDAVPAPELSRRLWTVTSSFSGARSGSRRTSNPQNLVRGRNYDAGSLSARRPYLNG